MKHLSIIILSLFISTSAALGHEFWISPEKYQVGSGENLVAALRGGQKFSGGPFSFLPQRFERFQLVKGEAEIEVVGRTGDRPALNMAAPEDGLWVVVHETTDSRITWKKWEDFVGFVEHKKLTGTLEAHAARGLPDAGFRESYRRFVKSLMTVGDGQGADREVGLLTEFVALANPYTDDITQGFPVLVLFEGAPRVDAQIEVFEKNASGEVVVSTLQTDAEGRALIPVQPGHEYLLDAVVMLPVEADNVTKDETWRSLWAALTFSVPG